VLKLRSAADNADEGLAVARRSICHSLPVSCGCSEDVSKSHGQDVPLRRGGFQLSPGNHLSRIGDFDALSKRVLIPSYGQDDDDCGNYAADDAYDEIHSFLAYSHPGPRRQSTSRSVLFAAFAAFFGDLAFSALTASLCGVSAFLAAFTVAACIAVVTVRSTRPLLMPLLMAFLTALSIAFRAFFSDSFLAISQYLNRRLMPQLGIVQGHPSAVFLAAAEATHHGNSTIFSKVGCKSRSL
jgi:hypothetical protein